MADTSEVTELESQEFPKSAAVDDRPVAPETYEVTFKTWVVVATLSAGFGCSFWVIPVLANISADMAAILGGEDKAVWWITTYTMCTAISSMVFGSNSDLFGRRWFIVIGNALVFIGLIILGSAKTADVVIAGCAIIGTGAGLAQQCAWAVPELLPNRVRHIAIVISEASTWTCVIVGPVAGRFAFHGAQHWRWLFYGPAIVTAVVFTLLLLLYFPPDHPRGIPRDQALRNLDYTGAFLFTVGAVLFLTGVVYTNTIPASSPIVIGLLVSGLASILIFALYEHFVPLEAPMCPPRVFAKCYGREFTFPFIAATIINMFYYSTNIAYVNQVSILYTDAETPLSYTLELTLPQNIGMMVGEIMLAVFGARIKHWRIQYLASVVGMVLFGALLSLGTTRNREMMMAFAFLCQFGYGWALTLSFVWIQFGVEQVELGIAGALAGTGRWTGGAIASSIYTTILNNILTRQSAKLVPAAAIAAGLNSSEIAALLAALPQGTAALKAIPGVTPQVIAVAWAAYQQSYTVALRMVCLSSLGFGGVAIICVLFCKDVSLKMTPKIEVFLENDVNAARNKFH